MLQPKTAVSNPLALVSAYSGVISLNSALQLSLFKLIPIPLHTLKKEGMGIRREYEIAFVGLKPGVHEYQYEIDDRFFEDYGAQDFTNTTASIKLSLDKSNGFMILRFAVGGKADVVCDRCGNDLLLQLFDDFTITVKLTEEPEVMNDQEEDPYVYYISRSESHIDVKDWIYEFVNLSVPMQKTCEYEAMDGPNCNTAARDLLSKMKTEAEVVQNPLWKGLEKFKDLDTE